eukprot:12182794-Alexandrium_andersonii.AAC.1
MSASLVGSEMCIRDRLLMREKPVNRAASRARQTLGLWGLSHERPIPVSYTHLTLPTICSV